MALEIDFSKIAFACSERTEQVDYTTIAQEAVKILGSKEMVVAWAWKLNTRGLKLKEGQFVQVADKKMTAQELIKKLEEQEGFANFKDKSVSRVGIGKTVVTATRIARAAARTVSMGIKAGKLDIGKDCAALRISAKLTDETELPTCFSFINASYGMSDDELAQYSKGMVKLLSAFQIEIDQAYKAGWVDSSRLKKRDYVKEYLDYCRFRGLATV